jgi:hypothetical protein
MAMPRSRRKSCLAALVPATLFVPMLAAQGVGVPPPGVPSPGAPQPGLGVRQPPPTSDLLDQLVGTWTITGMVLGLPVREIADSEWALGHQFLRFRRTQLEVGGVETLVYVGFDSVLQRYVAFKLDSLSGARNAETPGYGLRTGDKLEFTFDYPTAPIKETWSWDAKEKTWQFLVERKEKAVWVVFSTLNLRRIQGGRGLRGPAPLRLPTRPAPPPPPQ